MFLNSNHGPPNQQVSIDLFSGFCCARTQQTFHAPLFTESYKVRYVDSDVDRSPDFSVNFSCKNVFGLLRRCLPRLSM